MLNTIKALSISTLLALAVFLPAFGPVVVVHAADIKDGICGGAELSLQSSDCKNADKCTDDKGNNVSCSNQNLEKLINKIVLIFSMIVGVAAVIMIIYGGFRYVTSGGDSASVGVAKNTIIYALVGLVIAALAQVIVKFVLNAFIK